MATSNKYETHKSATFYLPEDFFNGSPAEVQSRIDGLVAQHGSDGVFNINIDRWDRADVQLEYRYWIPYTEEELSLMKERREKEKQARATRSARAKKAAAKAKETKARKKQEEVLKYLKENPEVLEQLGE